MHTASGRLLAGTAFALMLLFSPQLTWAAASDQAVLQCDTLASDPRDPNRFAAPVPEDRFAPGLAIAACKAAVEADPSLGRSWFQLGRAYWLGERDSAAFDAFLEAKTRGYAPAMKYLGDAYKDGRGLPNGERQSPETALTWYKMARAAGFRAADEDIASITSQIESLTFRPQLFQNPSYMTRIYTGNFDGLENPIMFFTYTRSLLDELGGNNIFFIDRKCTAAVTAIGTTVNSFGELFGFLQTFGSDNPLGSLIEQAIGSHFTEDQGKRDAVILMDNYKCDSPVSQKVIENISGNYNKLPNIIRAFVNSKQQMVTRRNSLLADIKSNCEHTFSRPGFCSCAVGAITRQSIDEGHLAALRSDFHAIGQFEGNHDFASSIRTCFHTPT